MHCVTLAVLCAWYIESLNCEAVNEESKKCDRVVAVCEHEQIVC